MFFSNSAVGVFSAIALSIPLLTQPTWAQSSEQNALQATQIIFNAPTPPNKGSPSGRQRGGASRGPCRQFESLTALVPATNGIVWGQTVSDRPTFWFYLPGALTETTPVEFVVQDAADNYIYNTRITAPGTTSGLIEISLPATAKSLEMGQPYFWTLSVSCNPDKPSESVFVKGMIQRINSTADWQNRLKSVPPLEQARLYAEQGLWYDTVNTLAGVYRAKSNDRQLASTWTTLLQQVNLGHLTNVPFSPCCTKP